MRSARVRELALSLAAATTLAAGVAGLFPPAASAAAEKAPAAEAAPAAETEAALPLWRVREAGADGASLYVLATVALGEDERLRFDPAVLDAFEQAGRLVLPDNAALSKQNALIGWKAHLAEGDVLSNWLPEEVFSGYVEAVGRAGFPPTYANVTAPWFAARMVRAADLRRTGFTPEREFEVFFAHLAEERGDPKPILPLEESATSYDRAAALSKPIQVEIMQRALADSARADSDLPAAAAAWKAGDLPALDGILRRSDREHPEWAESRSRTTTFESARLADGVRRLLAEPGPHTDFLLAESRYVIGTGGLLARLRQAGLQVTPVAARGGRAEPYPAPPLPAARTAPVRPAAGGRRTGRVLLVGIDGASLRIIRPLLAQGRLPHLAELARRGVSGALRSHRPLYSPRIWNSIATGKMPEKHGIEGFTFHDDAGKQQLYLSVHRKAHALWNIASKAGMRVAVVNWWNTYPPEVVNGVMVSDHAKPSAPGGAAQSDGRREDRRGRHRRHGISARLEGSGGGGVRAAPGDPGSRGSLPGQPRPAALAAEGGALEALPGRRRGGASLPRDRGPRSPRAARWSSCPASTGCPIACGPGWRRPRATPSPST